MTPPDDIAAVEAALAILNENGFDIASPRDGDLDDLEQERFNAVANACRAYLSAAQEGREAVAWLTEGYGYKRVFLEREAAEKLARGGDGTVLPLYTHHTPPQPAAQVVVKEAVRQELADVEASLDDAISYLIDLAGAKPTPMSPQNCRIHIDHARMSARNLAALASPTDADAAVVTEAQMKRAAQAVVTEWKKMIEEMSPHMTAGSLARSFVSPGNHRLIRAALTAAKAGEDGR